MRFHISLWYFGYRSSCHVIDRTSRDFFPQETFVACLRTTFFLLVVEVTDGFEVTNSF